MNCKPGNVALVIKGRQGNIGKIILVCSEYGDVDYALMGYGVLPCWYVESLGGNLDTVGGPALRGYIPDLALQLLPEIGKRQATAMRHAKARFDMDAAISELGRVLRGSPDMAEAEPATQTEKRDVPAEAAGGALFDGFADTESTCILLGQR